MKKTEFLELLKDALEIENVILTEETVFAEIDGYDSMGVMSIIALADEHFEVKFSSEQLKSMTSVKRLMELLGYEKFED
ncbi:MAG: acyl carrier protein [Bacteroidales bacterium]|nr:acyl carrier protein [Bacteroidales bacterium]